MPEDTLHAAPTDSARIAWQRVPVPRDELARLTRRSDVKGLVQAVAHLGLLAATGTAAVYSASHWHWGLTLAVTFVHGTFYAFTLNGFHELCHGTVFRTRALNEAFLRVYSFLGWLNYVGFQESHFRHHQYTLHPPADLEVVLPMRLTLKKYLLWEFVNLNGPFWTLKDYLSVAAGRLKGAWRLRLFPETGPSRRRELIGWARATLAGHAAIVAVSLWRGWWMVPVVTTLAPFYGTWLRFLCNEAQHVGLRDNVDDFRLCCRTIYLNPFLRFLYWHMNYHTEHHMYAAIPCYHLARLHAILRPHMPPTPDGLVQTWTRIAAILRRQRTDPAYQYTAELPTAATPS